MIPKRRTRPKMGVRQPDVVRCAGHLKWVRGHECLIAPKNLSTLHQCSGRIEAHHLQSFRAIEGGMGMKVGDDKCVPLCSNAHRAIHAVGQPAFERSHVLDLERIAAGLWKASPHGRAWRQQHAESEPRRASTPQAEE